MIGHISMGASFSSCISYCLEDKAELSLEQKLELSLQDELQHIDRAEVLSYNECFGDKDELARQFEDVRDLNQRVEKPVLHLSLRLAPGENLSEEQLIEMGEACAKAFGVEDHQYITVLHKDTQQQHIHIVANRVGFDGKVASDSHNYRKMAELCRKLEKQYQLKEVLSPRRFLSPAERLLPRHDQRKENLQTDIRQTLEQVKDYSAFEDRMKKLGYEVLKGRGIAFIDDKKVKIKGSEVGFSLGRIEKILKLKNELGIENLQQSLQLSQDQSSYARDEQHHYSKGLHMRQYTTMDEFFTAKKLEKELTHLLYKGLKQEPESEQLNPELVKEAKRKHYRGLSR